MTWRHVEAIERTSGGESVNHRLIMFVGTPGAGKSTFSRWLWQELTDRGVPVTLLAEVGVYPMEELQPFSKVYSRADPEDIRLLSAAVRSLCAEWDASGSVWITDQFLPAFHWLFGTYSPDHVRAYAEDLISIIAPLHPLLISLEADVRTAWQRAVTDRGQKCSDEMVKTFARRNLPLYPGKSICDLDTILRFFAWNERHCHSLFARWPVQALVLDTETTPLDRVQEKLLQHVGSSHVPKPRPNSP